MVMQTVMAIRAAATPVRTVVSVEQLLAWAFAREKVHLARRPGIGPLTRFCFSGGSDASTRIGLGGRAENNLGFEAPNDAYAVENALMLLDAKEKGIVLHVALSGVRPDWTPNPEIWWERGPAIYGFNKRKRLVVVGFCVSARGDVPEHLAVRRARYSAWVRGLTCVRDSLQCSGSLVAHAVTDELPEEKPWEGAAPKWWA